MDDNFLITKNKAMSNFFTELVKRWQAPTPAFFKKIMVAGISVSGLGTSLISIPGIPAIVAVIGSKLIVAGAIAAAVAKCAVTSSTSDIEAK